MGSVTESMAHFNFRGTSGRLFRRKWHHGIVACNQQGFADIEERRETDNRQTQTRTECGGRESATNYHTYFSTIASKSSGPANKQANNGKTAQIGKESHEREENKPPSGHAEYFGRLVYASRGPHRHIS